MTSNVDRKTYWDLLETLRWIHTRDEQLVAAMRDRSDEGRMALALSGMRVPLVIRSPPGPSGTNRGADLEAAAPQGDGQLLLGERLTGVAIPVGRVTGIALIALGVACWPGPPLVAMLIYSAFVTLYLAYVGFAGGLTGILLWPVV